MSISLASHTKDMQRFSIFCRICCTSDLHTSWHMLKRAIITEIFQNTSYPGRLLFLHDNLAEERASEINNKRDK